MPGVGRIRVPASSANLGPGFDVLALAINLYLTVEARESATTSVTWRGVGASDVPDDERNLIVRAAQEPFVKWSRPLVGVSVRIHNTIPVGRGLGSSAAALVAGIVLGARLRGLRIEPERIIELALPLEGHADNLTAALHGGFTLAVSENGIVRSHRLDWPARWRLVLFVPDAVSPTEEARRLVPRNPALQDAVFNLGRVAELMLAVRNRDGTLLRSALDDRLHQPGRASAYEYLPDMIYAAVEAGALGAALSGAGGSVIAVADRSLSRIASAMKRVAKAHRIDGQTLILRAVSRGPRL
ncbi:MAG TPA: homoserine kinase [Candidatus Dormibacteraeota bacterium]